MTHPKPTFLSFLLLLILSLQTITPSQAHQSMGGQTTIMSNLGCAGNGKDCKDSPCPLKRLRKDVNQDNPRIIVERGANFTINIRRNNHDYGFARYALVPVDQMHDFDSHKKNAFWYNCDDAEETKCKYWHSGRDCGRDKSGHYFKHRLIAPTHAPDGVYVLGWVWFGSLFEDWFDCTFIEIRGGELTESFQPVFDPSNSKTGEDGKCMATADEVGVCTFTLCSKGSIKLSPKVPASFNGKSPEPIEQSSITPYVKESSIRIKGIEIVDADNPSDSKYWTGDFEDGISTVHICLNDFKPSFVCVVDGDDIDFVKFYHRGNEYSEDKTAPYDMENSDNSDGTFDPPDEERFKGYKNTYFTISCMAQAKNGDTAWKSIEVSTMFDDDSC